MRSLTRTDTGAEVSAAENSNAELTSLKVSSWYESNRRQFQATHHSQCLFNRDPAIVPGLRFEFDDFGVLRGEFKCNGYQQGYDQLVHGGVIAAIIDASMAQCLMGHGIIGYTADLAVRYRKPVKIRTATRLETSIMSVKRNLYALKCTLTQYETCFIEADGKFFKVE